MGAPAQISPLEALVMERVLAHVLERAVPKLSGPVVIEFPQPTYPMDDDAIDDLGEPIASDTDDSGPALDSEPVPGTGQPLEVMRSLAEERARVEARMVTVAKDVLAATGAALLADKGFTSVSELSATATKKWRAEAKATAVAEIQLLLGIGVMAGRRLVGLAAAPPRTQSTVVAALARGEASLDMALRFWERCGSLPDEDGAEVADALFGTDPAIAAEERLDPEGGLRMGRPWHHGEYDAALEREALRRQARDADARREQRRRAREERDVTMRAHDDGTATITIRCPLTTGAAVYQRVDRCSRSLRGAGDPRTLRQLRADVAAATLLHGVLPLPGTGQDEEGQNKGGQEEAGQGESGQPGFGDLGVDDLVSPADLEEIARILSATPPVQLQVVIPWDVLTGRPAGAASCPAPCCRSGESDRDPPEQEPSGRAHRHRGSGRGRGAVGEILGLHQAFITPEHARVLAMQLDTTLARLLVDPADGRLIERTVRTYRPDADMRRQVRAADVMSRMPGSRRPAEWCDIDHEHPWAEGGPTSEANLNLKDRRPHSFKTKGWWRTTMAPNRDVTWTTLLGQSETTRCHDYRQYLEERAPLDPAQAELHPSQRTDREDRLDLACQALYAALVHRDPHAHLADDDDHHGATEHDPSLGGWVWVSHTNPDGVRRRGGPANHPTVADVLGIPRDDTAGRHDPRARTTDDMPSSPWQQRAADDDRPPF